MTSRNAAKHPNDRFVRHTFYFFPLSLFVLVELL